jgi:hypothetical protein
MKLVFTVFLLLFSVNIQANTFVQEPHCFKPNKPLIFSPQAYISRYEQDVKEYRQCIYLFISKQEQAIQVHKESIRHAEELLKQHLK